MVEIGYVFPIKVTHPFGPACNLCGKEADSGFGKYVYDPSFYWGYRVEITCERCMNEPERRNTKKT